MLKVCKTAPLPRRVGCPAPSLYQNLCRLHTDIYGVTAVYKPGWWADQGSDFMVVQWNPLFVVCNKKRWGRGEIRVCVWAAVNRQKGKKKKGGRERWKEGGGNPCQHSWKPGGEQPAEQTGWDTTSVRYSHSSVVTQVRQTHNTWFHWAGLAPCLMSHHNKHRRGSVRDDRLPTGSDWFCLYCSRHSCQDVMMSKQAKGMPLIVLLPLLLWM